MFIRAIMNDFNISVSSNLRWPLLQRTIHGPLLLTRCQLLSHSIMSRSNVNNLRIESWVVGNERIFRGWLEMVEYESQMVG